MEDNFLLQLSGSKTVLLLSQEGYPLVQPFSRFFTISHSSLFSTLFSFSLHPHWRHTQHSNLSDAHYLLSAMQQSFPLQTPSSSEAYRKPDSVGLWEVTLQAGDLLFVPAGCFHSMRAGPDSVSVNAWFPSTLSEVILSCLHFYETTNSTFLTCRLQRCIVVCWPWSFLSSAATLWSSNSVKPAQSFAVC